MRVLDYLKEARVVEFELAAGKTNVTVFEARDYHNYVVLREAEILQLIMELIEIVGQMG